MRENRIQKNNSNKSETSLFGCYYYIWNTFFVAAKVLRFYACSFEKCNQFMKGNQICSVQTIYVIYIYKHLYIYIECIYLYIYIYILHTLGWFEKETFDIKYSWVYVSVNLSYQAICKFSENIRQFVKCLFQSVNSQIVWKFYSTESTDFFWQIDWWRNRQFVNCQSINPKDRRFQGFIIYFFNNIYFFGLKNDRNNLKIFWKF